VDNILTAFSNPRLLRRARLPADSSGLFSPKISIGSYMNEKRIKEAPLFFLGSLLREDVYKIGGDDEDFIHPNYEDNWFFERLINGLKLTPIYTNSTKGFHQDHSAMENRNLHLQIYALFFKMEDAQKVKPLGHQQRIMAI
jgi:hypothetical protein